MSKDRNELVAARVRQALGEHNDDRDPVTFCVANLVNQFALLKRESKAMVIDLLHADALIKTLTGSPLFEDSKRERLGELFK